MSLEKKRKKKLGLPAYDGATLINLLEGVRGNKCKWVHAGFAPELPEVSFDSNFTRT
jgi:hypothetical protein